MIAVALSPRLSWFFKEANLDTHSWMTFTASKGFSTDWYCSIVLVLCCTKKVISVLCVCVKQCMHCGM